MAKEFRSYTYGEGTTGGGQVVRFTCAPEDKDKILASLADIRDVEIPTAHCVNVGHGGYGMYSRYCMKQHKYAGGGPGEGGGWGYIEVLEVSNPPNGRHGIVINECTSHSGATFTEWKTMEEAVAAWEKYWSSERTAEAFSKLPGFIRRVECGALTPWFYAVGDQELIGDCVFPEGFQNDPVYRFGRKFVVEEYNELPMIKTCMGCRIIEGKEDSYPYKPYTYRMIFWDDGTIWNECRAISNKPPRPLADDELWIDEAMQEFRKVLAGRSTKFDINFLDGNKFVGRVIRAKAENPSAEGRYYGIVYIEGEKKPRQGWFDFKPTPEMPDVITFLQKKIAKEGRTIRRVKVKDQETTPKGKKWSGVFFDRAAEIGVSQPVV